MIKNSFIKFVITVFLINFIFINPIFSANYEFVQQKIKELREGDLSKKLKAIEILGALSSNANFAIPEMINILRNEKDFELKMQVIRALERIGGQANLTVPALIESLSEEDWQIRWSAAGALESFGKKAASQDSNVCEESILTYFFFRGSRNRLVQDIINATRRQTRT